MRKALGLICTTAATAGLSVASVGYLAGSASAAPTSASSFTCGADPANLQPCNQSAHFSDPSGGNGPEVGSPSPQAVGCPAWISTDAPVITGTGNGVEHAIVNNALDGWFTSTFTGQVTVVFYTVDDTGAPVAPDTSAPTYTGHFTQWFGGSSNARNYVDHDTISFVGTGSDGSRISFHDVFHQSISAAPGAAPMTFQLDHC